MSKLIAAIACNLDAAILAASYPLFAEARVEAIEWSFDALYQRSHIPDWFKDLLQAYSKEKRLVAHGVFFSLFSGRWRPEQTEWLNLLKKTSEEFPFDHVTEHFGFMTGRDFHHGAPLNIPYNRATLEIGKDRLARIQEACNAPVGLENLAFSYNLDDVRRHGEFLEKLIAPVNGFIILDLHNLYCQLHNFSLSFDEVIRSYPLERVREIHISGGSWETHEGAPAKQVRRDTHDDVVPGEVFDLLKRTMPKCPNLKYVVLEQLGTALNTLQAQKQFYNDFIRLQEVVAAYESNELPENAFLPVRHKIKSPPLEDEVLHQQQLQLSEILENEEDYDNAMQALSKSSLAHSDWQVENWEPYMLATAMNIAKKWKKVN